MQQRLQIIDHFLGPVQLHPIPKHTMLSPAVNVPGFRPFRRRVVRCIVVVVDQTETAKVDQRGPKWAKVGTIQSVEWVPERGQRDEQQY